MKTSPARRAGPAGRRRKIGRLLLAVVVAATGGAAFIWTGVGPAAAAANTPVRSASSNRCLDVPGAATAAGTLVSIWDCNGGTNQAWTTTASGQLTVYGNRCLDGAAGADTDGDRVQIYDCNGGANQRWTFNGNGTLTNAATGRCLDLAANGTANGTVVHLWTCHGGANQRWSQTGGTTPPTNPPSNPPNPSNPCSVAPINPNATPQARRLLCYIYSQYGNHILSGQQESTWNGGPEYEMNYIQANTGRLPAIRALDMGDSPNFAGRAMTWWNAGGIPMVGYHMGSPANSADGYASSRLGANINAALTPGTTDYNRLVQRLDAVAAQLAQVQAIGGAVIFRPFHEAGGTWFWWSMEGGGQYNRLWRFAYDYLTNRKGLNNLVWLHGYNGSPQASFYPGKQYVDIGGADTYAGNGNYNPLTSMYNAVRNIVGTTVPIALHENGPIPDPDLMQSAGARWVLFGTWHGEHLTEGSSIEHLRKVYGHAYVVTRDEVPNLR